MSAKLATHWSPVGTMQRMVCLTPSGVELDTVGGEVGLVADVLLGLGVTETVGAEVVVKALKLASVVLWLLRLFVKVLIPEGSLALSVTMLATEVILELPVTVFAPKELLELSVTAFVLEETSELVKESEPASLTVTDAVTVSVTVTAGHVSIPWADVKAASREKIKAAMRSDIGHLDIILAAITNE